VLVTLMASIYAVRRWDGLRQHDTCIPRFMTISSAIQITLKVLPEELDRL
jgi:hypothetical protein